MDDAANRLARELIDAITVAIGRDPRVIECQRRAREAGIELKLAFEARAGSSSEGVAEPEVPVRAPRPAVTSRVYRLTAADRRFLRSLRIAGSEADDPEAC